MPWTTERVAPARAAQIMWPLERVVPPRPGGGGWQIVPQLAGADEGVGFDALALLVHLAASDGGVGQDNLALLAHLTAADGGVGQGTVALLAHLTGTDGVLGFDTASWLLHLDASAADSGLGQDNLALLAHLLATDSGLGQDSLALLAHLTASDSGLGQDTARPAYMNGWTGSKAATVLNHATWTDLFSFTAAGNGTATVNFSVAHSWGSNFLHFASETRGVRILVNGAQVAIQTQTYTTSTWSSTLTQNAVSVPAGATVQIQGYGETTVYSACRTVTISAASMTVTGVT